MSQDGLGTLLSHVELYVSNYAKSIQFYDKILIPLGWRRIVCQRSHTVFSDGYMKIVLGPVEEKYQTPPYHRKRVGLNHLAFYAPSKVCVDEFAERYLKPYNINCLYENESKGDETYYSIFFEDPDRIKIEIVYSPGYCSHSHWTNQLKDDFDPYAESSL
jgi:catechol 2,3-dioxygenase-like lactoylglutathione lyase family enzyme